MNTSTPKRRVISAAMKTAIVLLSLVLVGVASIIFSLVRPDRLSPVSAETTFITSPLTADGRPDYRSWLLERMGANYAIEDNGIRFLFPYVVAQDSELADYDLLLNHLQLTPDQLPPLEDVGPHFEESPWRFPMYWALEKAVNETQRIELQRGYELAELLDVRTVPWSASDFPEIASSLQAWSPVLKQVELASHQPVIYLPPSSMLNTGANARLVDVEIEVPIFISTARNQLLARAMLAAHEGDFAQSYAWIELYLRLANRVQPIGLAGFQIKSNSNSVAWDASTRLVELSASEAPALASEIFQSIPTTPEQLANVSKYIDEELVFQLASVEDPRWRDNWEEINELFDEEPSRLDKVLVSMSIDMEVGQRSIVQLTDLIRAAAAAPDSASLERAQRAVESKLMERDETGNSYRPLFNRKARSLRIAADQLDDLSELWTNFATTILDQKLRHSIRRIAMAIAIHRSENGGKLPTNLEVIRPRIGEELALFSAFEVEVQYNVTRADAYTLDLTRASFNSSNQFNWQWDAQLQTSTQILEQLQPIIERHQVAKQSF